MAATSETTTDQDTIRRWAEERDGRPATVRDTTDDTTGVLRIWFPDVGAGEEELKQISWEEFFQKFQESDLAFLYQEETSDGDISRFHKFIRRG